MVLTFVDAATRPSFGTFEPFTEVIRGTSWFKPVSSYKDLPRWWATWVRDVNVMLQAAGQPSPLSVATD